MDELLSMRLSGELSKEIFPAHYKPLKKQYHQLDKQLPEFEAELDFLKIQALPSNMILEEANNLYKGWSMLEYEQKRSIMETITEKITIGKQDITVALTYLPPPIRPFMQSEGKRHQHE